MADITLPAVYLAGLASFLSPCVLPLVPPYLTYLAGATIDELSDEKMDRGVRTRAVLAAITFMAGLATVFIALGASASLIGALLIDARRALAGVLVKMADIGILPMSWALSIDPFALVAGIIIIVMGLHFLGVFKITLLYRQARLESRVRGGMGGAYMMGLAFAFGWTPCIGPVLATVLAVAGREASVGYGAFLLAIYTAGLGLPFVIAAFAMNPFLKFLRRFRAHLATVEKVMGGVLVLTGLAFMTGGVSSFSIWIQSTFPGLASLG